MGILDGVGWTYLVLAGEGGWLECHVVKSSQQGGFDKSFFCLAAVFTVMFVLGCGPSESHRSSA